MMRKTNSWMRTKVLYIIPAAAIMFCAIACTESDKSDFTNEVYDKVEVMPEYPGGMESMMNFMKSNMKYPEIAMKSGATGRVIISFVVEKDGKVSDVKAVDFKADGEVSDECKDSLIAEAERVVANMPNWKPGQQKGENVRVKYTMPFTFRLQ